MIRLRYNSPDFIDCDYDLIVSVEVIEHLENPRAMARFLFDRLLPGGRCIVTTPNQESVRSLAALTFEGHFAAFRGASYPGHITALTRLDLLRVFQEAGFREIEIRYTNHGALPKLVGVNWQQISFGLLKGRRFSDNMAIIARRPA